MQKVSELTSEPEIGKFYLVPCVPTDDGEWWPVIGPKHEDLEHIGFPVEHYHYDLRFFSGDQLKATMLGLPSPMMRKSDDYALMAVAHSGKCGKPIDKYRKCQRPMPDFPVKFVQAWFPKLEAAYKSVKLSSCLKCPHRGLPLKGLSVKDALVVCPGHGLRWNVQTGEMVSRLSES
jgi:hypothetical protein